jgi:hypothetical protein
LKAGTRELKGAYDEMSQEIRETVKARETCEKVTLDYAYRATVTHRSLVDDTESCWYVDQIASTKRTRYTLVGQGRSNLQRLQSVRGHFRWKGRAGKTTRSWPGLLQKGTEGNSGDQDLRAITLREF